MQPTILLKQIANDITLINGSIYYVGGVVREYYHALINKQYQGSIIDFINLDNEYDIDVELHRVTLEQLIAILSKYGQVDIQGQAFGIVRIRGYNIDFSLPRIEHNLGLGYNNFLFNIDPYLGAIKAAKRRDFTVNSMMVNIKDNTLLDHYNGLNDIKSKLIDLVDINTFKDDSLRVIRALKFAYRLDYNYSKSFYDIAPKMIISDSVVLDRIISEISNLISIGITYQKLHDFFNNIAALNDIAFNYYRKNYIDFKTLLKEELSIINLTDLKTSIVIDFCRNKLFINKKQSKKFINEIIQDFYDESNDKFDCAYDIFIKFKTSIEVEHNILKAISHEVIIPKDIENKNRYNYLKDIRRAFYNTLV